MFVSNGMKNCEVKVLNVLQIYNFPQVCQYAYLHVPVHSDTYKSKNETIPFQNL
jgi:hypothetical protein